MKRVHEDRLGTQRIDLDCPTRRPYDRDSIEEHSNRVILTW